MWRQSWIISWLLDSFVSWVWYEHLTLARDRSGQCLPKSDCWAARQRWTKIGVKLEMNDDTNQRYIWSNRSGLAPSFLDITQFRWGGFPRLVRVVNYRADEQHIPVVTMLQPSRIAVGFCQCEAYHIVLYTYMQCINHFIFALIHGSQWQCRLLLVIYWQLRNVNMRMIIPLRS